MPFGAWLLTKPSRGLWPHPFQIPSWLRSRQPHILKSPPCCVMLRSCPGSASQSARAGPPLSLLRHGLLLCSLSAGPPPAGGEFCQTVSQGKFLGSAEEHRAKDLPSLISLFHPHPSPPLILLFLSQHPLLFIHHQEQLMEWVA